MKRIALFLLLALMAGFGSGVFAGSQLEKVTAFLDHDVRFTVKDKPWNPPVNPITGAPAAPLNYNGQLYLPLRAIADALDVRVDWDGVTKTVHLGSAQHTSLLDIPFEFSQNVHSDLSPSYISTDAVDTTAGGLERGKVMLVSPGPQQCSEDGYQGECYDQFNENGQVVFHLHGAYKKLVLVSAGVYNDMKMRVLNDQGEVIAAKDYKFSSQKARTTGDKTEVTYMQIDVEGIQNLTIQAASIEPRKPGWLWISSESFVAKE